MIVYYNPLVETRGMIRLETLIELKVLNSSRSGSNFSIRVVRACPLAETRQTAPYRAIRGNNISVSSIYIYMYIYIYAYIYIYISVPSPPLHHRNSIASRWVVSNGDIYIYIHIIFICIIYIYIYI